MARSKSSSGRSSSSGIRNTISDGNNRSANHANKSSGSSHLLSGRSSRNHRIKSGFPWTAVLGTTVLAGAAGVTWLLMKNKDSEQSMSEFMGDNQSDTDYDDLSDAGRYSSYSDDTDEYSDSYDRL